MLARVEYDAALAIDSHDTALRMCLVRMLHRQHSDMDAFVTHLQLCVDAPDITADMMCECAQMVVESSAGDDIILSILTTALRRFEHDARLHITMATHLSAQGRELSTAAAYCRAALRIDAANAHATALLADIEQQLIARRAHP